MKPLFYISKTSQFFKAFFKEFGAVISITILPKIGVFFITAMILFPGFVKAESFKPREVVPVFMDGSFVFEELPFKSFSISGDQSAVQDIEKMVFAETFYASEVDSDSEFSGCFNESFASVPSGGKRVVETLVDQGNDSSNDNWGRDSINHFFFGAEAENPFNHKLSVNFWFWLFVLWCFLWIIIFPIVLSG